MKKILNKEQTEHFIKQGVPKDMANKITTVVTLVGWKSQRIPLDRIIMNIKPN